MTFRSCTLKTTKGIVKEENEVKKPEISSMDVKFEFFPSHTGRSWPLRADSAQQSKKGVKNRQLYQSKDCSKPKKFDEK